MRINFEAATERILEEIDAASNRAFDDSDPSIRSLRILLDRFEGQLNEMTPQSRRAIMSVFTSRLNTLIAKIYYAVDYSALRAADYGTLDTAAQRFRETVKFLMSVK